MFSSPSLWGKTAAKDAAAVTTARYYSFDSSIVIARIDEGANRLNSNGHRILKLIVGVIFLSIASQSDFVVVTAADDESATTLTIWI